MKRKRQRGLRLNRRGATCAVCQSHATSFRQRTRYLGLWTTPYPAPEEVRMHCTTEHPYICYAIKRRATESYMTPNGTLKN